MTVPHPIASRTEEEIDDMVREAMPEIVRVLGAGLTIGAGDLSTGGRRTRRER